MKSYKFFSSDQYSNNFLEKDDTACIAFRAAYEFYKYNSPYDLSPVMFLHPASSKCDNITNFSNNLDSYDKLTDDFFLLARTGLYTGEAKAILHKCEKLNKVQMTNEQRVKNDYLINSSLFILNKFRQHSIGDLGTNPLFNCIYIISSIKLDFLKLFPNKKLTANKIYILEQEREKIKCDIQKTFINGNSFRYITAFNHSDEHDSKQISDFQDVIQKLEELNISSHYYLFLRTEMVRRYTEYIFNILLKNDKIEEAKKYSLKLISIDPYCPRAHYLHGKYLYISDQEASGEFVTSLSLNNQEKLSIKKILPPNSYPHFFIEEVQQKNNLLDRFGSFLNPTTYSKESTLALGPWMMWQSILNKRNPLFQTMTSQRAMPARFRHELYYALRFTNADCNISQLINYDSFLENTDVNVARFLFKKENKPLEKALQSRLLSSLGFYDQALSNLDLKIGSTNNFLNAHEAYYISTAFFIEQIINPNELTKIHSKYSAIWKRIQISDDTLRIRLAMQMSLAVISGQNDQKEQLSENYKHLMQILDELDLNSNISTFEKNLLKSRLYRASSYYPFRNKENQKLIYEINECKNFADLLIPTNDFEKKLIIENKFPMYESTARTYSAIGDHENAFHYMKKIVEEVDTNDPKAWLQIGEYYERFGKQNEAIECYKTATKLLCPLGKISAFKLGRAYEKINKQDDALFAHLTSIQLWPVGPSPLKQIFKLANQMNLSQLSLLADMTSEQIKNDYL